MRFGKGRWFRLGIGPARMGFAGFFIPAVMNVEDNHNIETASTQSTAAAVK